MKKICVFVLILSGVFMVFHHRYCDGFIYIVGDQDRGYLVDIQCFGTAIQYSTDTHFIVVDTDTTW